MRGYTLSSPELRRGGGRGGRTDGRCIWSREDRSSRYLITQRSDWKRRGWKWTERLLLPGQWHFRWILLGRTREMMVLEDNSSPSTDQNSLPGGSPIVTSMRTPHSVGTSRPRSRCFFWLFAVTRMATKWYPEVKKQREREREKSQKAPVHCWGDVFFERKKKKSTKEGNLTFADQQRFTLGMFLMTRGLSVCTFPFRRHLGGTAVCVFCLYFLI